MSASAESRSTCWSRSGPLRSLSVGPAICAPPVATQRIPFHHGVADGVSFHREAADASGKVDGIPDEFGVGHRRHVAVLEVLARSTSRKGSTPKSRRNNCFIRDSTAADARRGLPLSIQHATACYGQLAIIGACRIGVNRLRSDHPAKAESKRTASAATILPRQTPIPRLMHRYGIRLTAGGKLVYRPSLMFQAVVGSFRKS